MINRSLTAAALFCSSLYAQQLNFVACPIVRDTKTTPCYLADYNGETYFLGTQESAGDHAPQLKHEVLVEGTVTPGPRVCGGIPLQPVSISVMPEINLACNTLLPAEPGIEAPKPSPVVPVTASGPEFTLRYAFDAEHIDARDERILSEAVAWAKRGAGASIQVTGYRGTTMLSNGRQLTEKPELAQIRAENVASLLRALSAGNVASDWKTEPGERQVRIRINQAQRSR